MKNILLFIFVLTAGHLLAQCPGPAQRNALINLQRSLVVESTRAGQIPLTDTCGNQRYAQYVEVNPDTINYIPDTTGNTQNLSEFVRDTLGALWYIDWQGNAVQFSGGSSCDTDWLEIADNNCPDALTDSIYKYRYVAIGARYVFPGAELLVNDSVSSGITVIQGFRNSRLALWDSNVGTFSMIDHGGLTPVWYMPVNANLIFKTTAGTPQTPVGSQVNHFAINTQDSTIQAFQYPSTRADTQSVVNFLYTDPVGKLRSRPITYLEDSLGFGANIYNSNGFIPAEVEREVYLDTLSEVKFMYPAGGYALEVYAGNDSSSTGGAASLQSPSEETFIYVDDSGISAASPGTVEVGDRNAEAYGLGVFINNNSGLLEIGDTYDNQQAISRYDITTNTVTSIGGLGAILSIGENTVPDGLNGVEVALGDGYSFTVHGDYDITDATMNFSAVQFEAISTDQQGRGSNFRIFADTVGNAAFRVRANDPEQSAGVYAQTLDGDSPNVTLQAYEAAGTPYTIGEIIIEPAGVSINTQGGTGQPGDVLHSDGTRAYWDEPGGGNTIYSASDQLQDVDRTVMLAENGYLHFLYANSATAIEMDDFGTVIINNKDGESQIEVGTNHITLETSGIAESVNITTTGNLNVNVASTVALCADGVGVVAIGAADTPVPLYFHDGGGDANYGTTISAGVQTEDIDYVLPVSQASSGQCLKDDGTGAWYWDDPLPGGILNADQLSYTGGSGSWTPVNANRFLVQQASGTLTPSIAITEIIVNDTATTSTVNLNYVPGDLDGALYSQPFTTVRYIYNWGSGDCTVDTNQDWGFRIQGDGTPNTTLTIPTGQSYKLIWVQGNTEAESAFWCFRIN